MHVNEPGHANPTPRVFRTYHPMGTIARSENLVPPRKQSFRKCTSPYTDLPPSNLFLRSRDFESRFL